MKYTVLLSIMLFHLPALAMNESNSEHAENDSIIEHLQKKHDKIQATIANLAQEKDILIQNEYPPTINVLKQCVIQKHIDLINAYTKEAARIQSQIVALERIETKFFALEKAYADKIVGEWDESVYCMVCARNNQ